VLWTASSSDISWIGSIQALCLLLGAAFAGPLYDRGNLRSLLAVGTIGAVFGHMMLSITKAYWQVMLAQGILIGLSCSLLFVPSLAVLSGYFQKKLGLAVGIAASGSSLGGIVYPIMFYKLIGEVGFGWAVRILGFTVLATLLVPLALMRIRIPPAKVRSIMDWSVWTDFPFLLFILGGALGFVGVYTGNFYTSLYGQAAGLTGESLSFYLVPILNAGSCFGRIVPNIISDKLGPLNVLIPASAVFGIVLLCYLAITNAAGLIVCALLFGFFSGLFISIPPVITVALTKDKSMVGTRIGWGFALISCGALAGGPGSGGILGTGRDLHWQAMWIYGGVTPIAASVVFLALRLYLTGLKLGEKI
jgi:MFS family permease